MAALKQAVTSRPRSISKRSVSSRHASLFCVDDFTTESQRTQGEHRRQHDGQQRRNHSYESTASEVGARDFRFDPRPPFRVFMRLLVILPFESLPCDRALVVSVTLVEKSGPFLRLRVSKLTTKRVHLRLDLGSTDPIIYVCLHHRTGRGFSRPAKTMRVLALNRKPVMAKATETDSEGGREDLGRATVMHAASARAEAAIDPRPGGAAAGLPERLFVAFVLFGIAGSRDDLCDGPTRRSRTRSLPMNCRGCDGSLPVDRSERERQGGGRS